MIQKNSPFLLLITTPGAILTNIVAIEWKDSISFGFTAAISLIAIITGILAIKNYALKNKLTRLEIRQKEAELRQAKKAQAPKKAAPMPDSTP